MQYDGKWFCWKVFGNLTHFSGWFGDALLWSSQEVKIGDLPDFNFFRLASLHWLLVMSVRWPHTHFRKELFNIKNFFKTFTWHLCLVYILGKTCFFFYFPLTRLGWMIEQYVSKYLSTAFYLGRSKINMELASQHNNSRTRHNNSDEPFH